MTSFVVMMTSHDKSEFEISRSKLYFYILLVNVLPEMAEINKFTPRNG